MDVPASSPQGVLLTQEQIEAMLNRAAEYGAKKALSDIGLHDDDAADDVRELRNLIDTWRDTKRTAWKTFISWGVKGLLLALVAGLWFKTGQTPLK